MNNVSKTLYIPLYGKAYVSRKGIILSDPDAEAIWDKEGFPLRGKSRSKWLAYSMAMRSKVFDTWAEETIKQYDAPLVLHIGCGMDSRYRRLGTGTAGCTWYDIDFPGVIDQRQQYFAPADGYHILPGDASQTEWIDILPAADNVILVLEGLSMYLTPTELTDLLRTLAGHFTNLHVLMDCYTTFGAKMSKYKNPINSVGVTQTYGLDDPELLAENAELIFVKEHDMTPKELIAQLSKSEQAIFRKLFAGTFAKKIYRMYEFAGNTNG